MRLPLVASVALRLLTHEPRRRDGLRLAGVTAWLWLRLRLGRDGAPLTVHVTAPNGVRARLELRTYIDMLVVREVFLDRDYRVPDGLTVGSILDLGSNTGVSIGYFRALYPGAVIVGAEPDPRLFDGLLRNTRGLENVRVRPVAVAQERGRASFFTADEGWASSLSRPAGRSRQVEVDCETVDGLLDDAGLEHVDLVKVDIEGGEWPLLEGGQLQRVTGCIVGELHHDAPQHSVDAARRALAGWSVTVHESRGAVSSFTAVRR